MSPVLRDFARAFLVVFAIWWLAACSATEPIATPEPRVVIVAPVMPPIVREAARTRAQAWRYVDRRPYLSSADLIQMLELSQDMERAIRRVQVHRSAANERTAKDAIDALRDFMTAHKRE